LVAKMTAGSVPALRWAAAPSARAGTRRAAARLMREAWPVRKKQIMIGSSV
jgi:hypothetical protein